MSLGDPAVMHDAIVWRHRGLIESLEFESCRMSPGQSPQPHIPHALSPKDDKYKNSMLSSDWLHHATNGFRRKAHAVYLVITDLGFHQFLATTSLVFGHRCP